MATNPYIVRRAPATSSSSSSSSAHATVGAAAPDAVARFNERPPANPHPAVHRSDPNSGAGAGGSIGIDLVAVLSMLLMLAAVATLVTMTVARMRSPVLRYVSLMTLSVAAGNLVRRHLLPPAWLMEQYARDLLRGNDTLAWLVMAALAATVVFIARWQYRLKWLST